MFKSLLNALPASSCESAGGGWCFLVLRRTFGSRERRFKTVLR